MSASFSLRLVLVAALATLSFNACRPGGVDAEAAAPSAEAAAAEPEQASGEPAAEGSVTEVAQAQAGSPTLVIEPSGVTASQVLGQLPWSVDVEMAGVVSVGGLMQVTEALAEGTPFDEAFLRAQLRAYSAMAGPMLIGVALPIDLSQAEDIGFLVASDERVLVVAYADAWSGQQTEGQGQAGAFSLNDGWLRMGDAALVEATPGSAASVPRLIGGLAQDPLVAVSVGGEVAAEFDVSAAAIAVEPNGRMVAQIDAADVDGILTELATMRESVPAALDRARQNVTETQAPWLDYVDLMYRAAWSRLRATRRDGGLTLELPAPTCGDLRQQYVAAILLGIGMDLPAVETPVTWTDWDAPIAAGCNPLRGTPASLPADAARIASAEVPDGWGSMLFVADVAWLARNALPDGMGSMPFAVEPDAIAALFDGRPAGLADWTDEAADTLWYFESTGDLRNDVRGVIVLPDGLAQLMPLDEFHEDGDTIIRGDSGWTAIVAGDLVGNLTHEAPETALSRAMAVAELDAPFAFIADQAALSQLATEMRQTVPGGLTDLVGGSESVILSWTDRGLLLRFTVVGDRDAVLSTADAHLQVLLGQARAAASQALGMPLGATLLDDLALSASGERQIDFMLLGSSEMLTTFALPMAAIAVPAFMKYIDRSKTSEATMNIRRVFDGSAIYFAMQPDPATATFPPSVGPTPAIVPGATPCDTRMAPDPTLWQHPTWQALSFEVNDPHYYVYQYDSQGVGEDASFTASAFGDLDCDGVYSTFVRFGEVLNGEVAGSAGLYIQSELE